MSIEAVKTKMSAYMVNAKMTVMLKERMIQFEGVCELGIRHFLSQGFDTSLVSMSGIC